MSDTKNQHFLPQWFIKKWIIEGKIYNVYNKLTESYTKISLNNKKKDVFSKDFFYENDNFDFNEIENKLSEMEKFLAEIFYQITEKINKFKSLKLIRKELLAIKLFYVLQSLRSNSLRTRLIKLDGDALFNKMQKEISESERINNQINNINYLYNEVYCKIINEEKIKLCSILENDKIMTSEYMFSKIVQCTFLNFAKISYDMRSNFIMSDLGSVQAVDPITSSAILSFLPISPKYCIVFCKTMAINSEDKDKIAKDFFLNGFELMKEEFNSRFLIRNNGSQWINKPFENYNDKYTYQIIEFNNEEEIWTINGLLHSQTIDNLLYIETNDIINAQQQIKNKNIYRIEEQNR